MDCLFINARRLQQRVYGIKLICSVSSEWNLFSIFLSAIYTLEDLKRRF
jgi:hypothetical protein